MIFNGDIRGLAGFIYNNPTGQGVPGGLRGFGGTVDMRVPYNLRNPLMGYGVDAGDVGTAIGAGAGGLLSQLFPSAFPRQQGVPYTSGGLVTVQQPPSWWGQQTTGTKVLLGGIGFLGVAAAIAALRKKSS